MNEDRDQGQTTPATATAAADQALVRVPEPTSAPAWLVETLRQQPAAWDYYVAEFRQDYAWLESNEIEGPGADLDRRRAAYARYSAQIDVAARVYVRLDDRFLAREIMGVASHEAFEVYQCDRALLISASVAARGRGCAVQRRSSRGPRSAGIA